MKFRHRKPVVRRKRFAPRPRKPTLNKGPRRKPNPLRVDPTRTSLLRRKFVAAVRKGFAKLKLRVVDLVRKEDAFGLAPPAPSPFALARNSRWAGRSNPEKVKAFKEWLRQQLRETVTGKSDEDLWRAYVEQGWRKGASRAFDDVRRPAKARGEALRPAGEVAPQLDWYNGTRDEFLRSAFSRPVAVEKVQLLADRSFSDLEGVTADMEARMTRILADGLTQGQSPLDVARTLADQVDLGEARAETIARTELIRAHSEGQLEGMELLGVKEVGVMVEWVVTNDDRLCPACAELEGVVLTLEEARGMLPRHPNCRCSWVPANVGEDAKEQVRSKEDVEDALEQSRRAGGESDEGEGRAWNPGPISADRPRSILNARWQRLPERDRRALEEFSRLLAANRERCRDDKGKFAPCGFSGDLGQAKDDVAHDPAHPITAKIRQDQQTRKIQADLAVLHQRREDNEARANKLRDKIAAIGSKVHLAVRGGAEKTKAGRERLKELNAQQAELSQRFRDNREERDRLAEMAREKLALPEGSRGSVSSSFLSGNVDPEEQRHTEAGRGFVERLVHPGIRLAVNVRASNHEDAEPSLIEDEYAGRAQYRYSTSTVHNTREALWSPRAVIHELGHAIEHQNPAVLEASLAFLDRRAGGETMRPMSDLRDGFHEDEAGRDDDFARAFGGDAVKGRYAGKQYWSGNRRNGTEIMSLGVEQLHRDPVGFARNDPEYFRFVVGVLHGRVR